MPKFFSDSPDSIEQIFSFEGDALAHAGFTEPDVSSMPEDFDPRMISAYDEAAALGHDLDDHLEG